MKKKVDARDLVEKIAALARERVSAGPVVSMEDLKAISERKPPQTILLIEDDEMVRRTLERILRLDGHRVLAVRDGVEMKDVLHDTNVDLVMLDVGLPWINGFEIAELMRANADLESVPIVFISGHQDQAMVKRGFAVGANDYITKPFEVDKVRKTVNTLLELNS